MKFEDRSVAFGANYQTQSGSTDGHSDELEWISSKQDVSSGGFFFFLNPTGRKHILLSHMSQNAIYEATGNVVLILAAGPQLIFFGPAPGIETSSKETEHVTNNE